MNKGKYFEEIVELLERSINPDSKVERDVQMPILNSKYGFTTQCDIVITSGKKPRENVTIVEVQNRSKKPSLNDFRGWLKKLEDVGAQQLICVSRKGFTKNIRESASQLGQQVMLVRLEEINAESIPLNFFQMNANYQEFNLDTILNNSFDLNETDLIIYGLDEKRVGLGKLSSNAKIFSYDKRELLSLKDICADKVPVLKKAASGIDEIKIDYKTPFYLFTNNVFIRLELYLEFEWTKTVTVIPVKLLSYEQDEYGVLAWMVQGHLKTVNGIIDFRVPIRKFEDGYSINEYWVDKPETIKLIFEPILKD